MIILKLGGSVITKKDEPMSLCETRIKRLAGEVSDSLPKDLIIIHGGGSFGHPVAKKFRIAEGFNRAEQIIGFSKTHQAMLLLNKHLVDSLLEKGVPAISICPSSFIQTDNNRITDLNLSIIKHFLKLGMVPILFGDAVIDKSLGFCILSGDQIVAKLALGLSSDRVLLGTDVDGIFSSDPKKNYSSILLKKFSLRKSQNVEMSGSLSIDVTGGMANKVEEMRPVVEGGIKVIVLNAGVEGRIRDALEGKNVLGTKLEV